MAGNNSSSAAGFLTPIGAPIPYDDELIDLIQPIFVGVSGIPGKMMRPRWQIEDVPNMPEVGETWAALGIARTRSDAFHYEEHVAEGVGYDYQQRDEELDVLLSVYGPNAKSIAEQVRDSIALAQNREFFHNLKMDLIIVGEAIMLPALTAGKWQRRVDVTVTLRRVVERRYGINTIVELSDGMGIDNELYITPIVADAP